MSKMLKYQSSEFGLVDAWRSKFTNCRHFTFYSHRYASYSRIDFFFFLLPKMSLKNRRYEDITNDNLRPFTYGTNKEHRTWTNFQTMEIKCLASQ